MTARRLNVGSKTRIAHFERENVKVALWFTMHSERDSYYTITRSEGDEYKVNTYADKGAAFNAFRAMVSRELPEVLR